jgi:hypothetical protein
MVFVPKEASAGATFVRLDWTNVAIQPQVGIADS